MNRNTLTQCYSCGVTIESDGVCCECVQSSEENLRAKIEKLQSDLATAQEQKFILPIWNRMREYCRHRKETFCFYPSGKVGCFFETCGAIHDTEPLTSGIVFPTLQEVTDNDAGFYICPKHDECTHGNCSHKQFHEREDRCTGTWPCEDMETGFTFDGECIPMSEYKESQDSEASA